MIANKEPFSLVHFAQYYQDVLPSSEEGVKESYSREQSTLARIAEMQKNALFKGHLLTLKSKAHVKESEKLFAEPKRVKKENIPTIKMSELEPLELHE